MEKRMVLTVVVVAILAFAGVARGGEFVITGYESKKFAVTDDIKRQIDEEILASIERDPANKPGGTVLKVLVIGSADITGISAENDPLSKNRAEPVAAILEHRLPLGTMINVVPRGDAGNKRQVRVEWNFVPIPKPESAPVIPQTPMEVNWRLVGFFGVMFVIALILATIAIRGRKPKQNVSRSPEIRPEIRWVEGEEMDGKKYSVPIEVRDGKFFTPFKTLEDQTKPLFRSNFQDAKKAAKGCMSDVRYAVQKAELIRRGVIPLKS